MILFFFSFFFNFFLLISKYQNLFEKKDAKICLSPWTDCPYHQKPYCFYTFRSSKKDSIGATCQTFEVYCCHKQLKIPFALVFRAGEWNILLNNELLSPSCNFFLPLFIIIWNELSNNNKKNENIKFID